MSNFMAHYRHAPSACASLRQQEHACASLRIPQGQLAWTFVSAQIKKRPKRLISFRTFLEIKLKL